MSIKELTEEEIKYFFSQTTKEKWNFLEKFWDIEILENSIFYGIIRKRDRNNYYIEIVKNFDGKPLLNFKKTFLLIYIYMLDNYKNDSSFLDGDLVKIYKKDLVFSKKNNQNLSTLDLMCYINKLEKLYYVPNGFYTKSNDGIYIDEHLKNEINKKVESEYAKKEILLKENYEQKKNDFHEKIKIEEEKYIKNINDKQNIEKILDQTIEEKQKKEQELDDIIAYQESEKNENENILNEFKSKLKILEALGLLHKTQIKETKNENAILPVYKGSCEDAIEQIHGYLCCNNSYYSKAQLTNFMALLNTHDVIILAGDSGVGKTYLVSSLANAVGGIHKIIPVKPNWTSSDDLLGYYNPLEKRYVTTPFLDAILEARNNPQQLYFICLDEMNLSRVEYYFADFLSKLEDRSNREITIYSDNERKIIEHELKNIGNRLESLDKEDEIKLIASKIPNRLEIPTNVRFLGTINVDDTTYYLSPKILDRVHILRFNNPILNDEYDEIFSCSQDFKQPINIESISFFDKLENYPSFVDHRNDEYVKSIIILAKQLDLIGISIGARVINQAILYKQSMEKFGESNANIILNNFIMQKILPKLLLDGSEVTKEKITKLEKLKELLQFIEDLFSEQLNIDSCCFNCIEELKGTIEKAENNNQQVNYWVR
ncbi:MAG: McrB family protein [Succinivibrionaceae bacterium]